MGTGLAGTAIGMTIGVSLRIGSTAVAIGHSSFHPSELLVFSLLGWVGNIVNAEIAYEPNIAHFKPLNVRHNEAGRQLSMNPYR
jgi:hypothetical protein